MTKAVTVYLEDLAVSYYVERAFHAADTTEQSAADYEDILVACLRGDWEPAAATLVDHLEQSAVVAVASAPHLYKPRSLAR